MGTAPDVRQRGGTLLKGKPRTDRNRERALSAGTGSAAAASKGTPGGTTAILTSGSWSFHLIVDMVIRARLAALLIWRYGHIEENGGARLQPGEPDSAATEAMWPRGQHMNAPFYPKESLERHVH